MKAEIFGKLFTCDKYKPIPIRKIKDKSLRELYKIFKTLLPDHPDEDNTVVYFLHREEEATVDLIWTCTHFECTSPEEISGIVYFLLDLQWHMGPMAEIHLDLLDGFWEKLIITVYNAPFKFPKRFKDVKNLLVDYGEESVCGETP